jgi:hypothetical protein
MGYGCSRIRSPSRFEFGKQIVGRDAFLAIRFLQRQLQLGLQVGWQPDGGTHVASTIVSRRAVSGFINQGAHTTVTGIFPIFACHSRGPVLCTLVPSALTATVTGMSLTSNS